LQLGVFLYEVFNIIYSYTHKFLLRYHKQIQFKQLGQ
jgi:hypothetical protein